MAFTGGLRCFLMTLVLVLACGLVLSGPFAAAARPPLFAGKGGADGAVRSDDTDFSYFVYTVTWPGTFCEEHHCERQPSKFTIHGLWPNYATPGKWPAFCNSSYPFNESEIEDLLPEMDQNWPDMLSKQGSQKSVWLWTHEWEKHGTCSAPVLKGEHAYFSKALSLVGALKPSTTLSNAGITPSDSASYSFAHVLETVVKSVNGRQVNIGCQNKGEDLYQIEYCLGLDFQPISCPKADSNTNCKTSIRLPRHQ